MVSTYEYLAPISSRAALASASCSGFWTVPKQTEMPEVSLKQSWDQQECFDRLLRPTEDSLDGVRADTNDVGGVRAGSGLPVNSNHARCQKRSKKFARI